MLDFRVMNTAVDSGNAFFTIDENSMMVNMYREKFDLIETDGDLHDVFFTEKLLAFPVGSNLFNFLSIPHDELRVLSTFVRNKDRWDEKHNKDSVSDFIASLDVVYLYLIFYSFDSGSLGNEYRSRLEYISKEFDFALNFCCNDEFDPKLKPLSAMQRYYIYSQLYSDNILTIDRYFEQSNSLFLEPDKRLPELDRHPRLRVKQSMSDHEPRPITDKPTLSNSIIKKMSTNNIQPIFRFRCETLQAYLRAELFTLIKTDTRIKKCKGCGQYFVLKGDYATDYCERILDGEKYTCRKRAAIATRKAKVQNNPILKEYEKAYKRNFARVSNHLMTTEEFRLWADEATQRRNQAAVQYQSASSGQIINDFKEYLGNK